ncbi:MAG: class I SAM-dependent methyltransferase [Acidimicrobiia bacterium]
MASTASGPTERELRLIGPIAGKRVLDLGCGTGPAAINFAKQGAVVIAVDGSRAKLEEAHRRAEAEETKVEFREGDLADLAFLRADSIDVAFSGGAIAVVDDLARVFRQVQRVLRPHAAFVFSYDHPFALGVGPDGMVRHSYFDPGPVTVDRDGEQIQLFTRSISEIFTELGRAGFRVDTIVEPRPARYDDKLPSEIIWRARKEGT